MDTIRLIRAFAEMQANLNTVYALAQIPPPATPQPRPAPKAPTDFSVELNQTGSLTLRWRCITNGGSGIVYQVRRAVGGTGGGAASFVPIGVSGVRSFTDTTLPASAAAEGGVTYVVQARRGEVVSDESLPFTVMFGISGGGLTITGSFAGMAEKKMAA